MIYLDYNATTPLCDAAHRAMLPFLRGEFGNPSSIHAAGRRARAAVDEARDCLAGLLRTQPHELIFTGGGTEANNLAVLGLARSRTAHGRHLISARTEHHAVLNTLVHLELREGFEVTWLDVSTDGSIDPQQLEEAIRDDTILVSLMQANNETGVITPLAEISAICRARGVLLHSDMVQSFGKVAPTASKTDGGAGETNLPRENAHYVSLVDAASFAAHKFYGPKGAGLLFLRRGLALDPIHFGGAHENQRRPGTENVAAIAGMAAAAVEAMRCLGEEYAREAALRDELWEEIRQLAPSVCRNGGESVALPNTLNLSFPELDSETMLMALDLAGVCASSGSACMVGSVVASHVLLAMGLPLERASSAIRFSLGQFTAAEEIGATANIVGGIIDRYNARHFSQTPRAVAVGTA